MFVFLDIVFFSFSRASPPRVVVNEFWTNVSTIPSDIEFNELSSGTSYAITVAVSVNGTMGPPTRQLSVATLSSSNFTLFIVLD